MLFGYALLVRCRPSKTFWKVLLLYSGIISLIKYALELTYAYLKHVDFSKIQRFYYENQINVIFIFKFLYLFDRAV